MVPKFVDLVCCVILGHLVGSNWQLHDSEYSGIYFLRLSFELIVVM